MWTAETSRQPSTVAMALADEGGVRAMLVMGPWWRTYFDTLPHDPLSDPGERAAMTARRAWCRLQTGRWRTMTLSALASIRHSGSAAARSSEPIIAGDDPAVRVVRVRRNVLGFRAHEGTERRCGDCAWGDAGRCVMAQEEGEAAPSVRSAEPGCLHWETPLDLEDCRRCGACCREGYGAVMVEPGAAMLADHPEWVRDEGWGAHLPRPRGACVALSESAPWMCGAYAVRPRSCREFTVGGRSCLVARCRTGHSGRSD